MIEKFPVQSIEEHLFRAWPALTSHHYDGWILRFAKGHTRRANSVNPMYESSLDTNEKITYCEDKYREQQIPINFRLTPLVSPSGLSDVLEEKGYKKSSPIRVRGIDLTQIPEQTEESQTVIHTEFSELWFKHYIRLNNQSEEKAKIIRQMLEATFINKYYAAIRQDDDIAVVGYGACDGNYLALFQIATHPDYRRRGLGQTLVNDMIQFAKAKGASLAYLQVEPENTAAMQMYDKMEFLELYQYWYYSK